MLNLLVDFRKMNILRIRWNLKILQPAAMITGED